MSLKHAVDFIARHLRRVTSSAAQDEAAQSLARRHKSFRVFLSAWNDFQETVSDIKYTICCDHPFGLHRVRELCIRVTTQTFQCIQQLKNLDPQPCATLSERFSSLQKLVSKEFEVSEQCLLGPLVLPLGDGEVVHIQGQSLVDPATVRLEEIRSLLPEALPQGFVVTTAGCQRYFQHNGLQDEINRRIQIAGGLHPKNLRKLAEQLKQLVEETPLPSLLRTQIMEQVTRLRSLYPSHDMQIVFRGRVWPPEAGEECGVVVWGPAEDLWADDACIEKAILATLARKQGAQCLVYRRARGLTEASTGICLTSLVIPKGSFGGLAQSCAPLRTTSKNTHVYGSAKLPQELEYGNEPADRVSVSRTSPYMVTKRHPIDPQQTVLTDTVAQRAAALARAAEEMAGCPQVVSWVATPQQKMLLLMTRPMTKPMPTADGIVASTDPLAPLNLHGFTVAPGRVSGPVWPARSWEDLRNLPSGAIVVVPDDSYIWGFVIDRCAGFIVERGFQASRLASLTREFAKPALFGVEGALSAFTPKAWITLCADEGKIFLGKHEEVLPKKSAGRNFMPESPVFGILQRAAEHILPQTMDVDGVDFRANNCQTYNDLVNFCHERAVAAMFSTGSDKHNASKRVKQLYDQVPKQFWVVNLSDGFVREPQGPLIDVSDIASIPMRALWQGMTAYPWEGPPPVDGKGFLSVLFEATANPNLDPATQSTYFTEKNYFLVSRHYASLHSRFGFHFVSVESRLSEHSSRNYLTFQMRGGAADMQRRILRVRFVADILWEFGFEPLVHNDAVMATIKNIRAEDGDHFLAVAGYLTIHTRQLDMIMLDTAQVQEKRRQIIAHCRTLFTSDLSQSQS